MIAQQPKIETVREGRRALNNTCVTINKQCERASDIRSKSDHLNIQYELHQERFDKYIRLNLKYI